jgi:HEPN domain-containing protein
MKYLMLALLLATTSCAVKVETDPIEVEPAIVEHIITIDPTSLDRYMLERCQDAYDRSESDYEEQVDKCRAESVIAFMEIFKAVSK